MGGLPRVTAGASVPAHGVSWLGSLGRLGVISASFPTHQQVDGCEHNNGDDEGHSPRFFLALITLKTIRRD
jgi:hypothetical protein